MRVRVNSYGHLYPGIQRFECTVARVGVVRSGVDNPVPDIFYF